MIPAQMAILAALQNRLDAARGMRTHLEQNAETLTAAQFHACTDGLRRLLREAAELTEAADRLTK